MNTIIQNQRKERDELLARHYLMRKSNTDVKTLLDNPMIKLITGPRRVGKSTYALLMLQGKSFAYLNFDDNLLLSAWDEELVMRTLDEVYPNYEFLLLDEVQNLKDWDVWVSKLYRRGKNLVITGSNAKMLSGEMATVLTGRYLQVEMLPFSLTETIEWKGANINSISNAKQAEAVAIADDYLRNGGYPETIDMRSITRNYLSTLFDSIIWKDVAKRHNIRNITDLNNIALYLLSNFCNPLSANDIAKELSMTSVTTTRKFMDYLHEPYLFYYLPRFNNKLKLMKKAASKVYVIDNGFVAAKAFNLSENLGRLLENEVFVELLRQGYQVETSLFYYRSRNDREVDFVTRQGTHINQLIQVCYDMTSPKTEKREVSSLIECAGELKCNNLLIITNNEEREIHTDGYNIKVIPFIKYGLGNI
ncbi:MAG: ATP-binding protein [Prevotella sp.]|mgnify:FL=1|nr:ATP-binding protein [Paraprevotella sp.]MCI7314505.1 ATP-binding protein [Prevotella sp.]MDD7709020.1 ATP-binding protein [Prevotella sp.]MDY4150779.1 ATP-binding protein [Prevotella sp.]